MDRLFYRAKDVAEAMSIPEDTIRRWARLGRIASKKVGDTVLIPAAEFARLTAGHDQTADQTSPDAA